MENGFLINNPDEKCPTTKEANDVFEGVQNEILDNEKVTTEALFDLKKQIDDLKNYLNNYLQA